MGEINQDPLGKDRLEENGDCGVTCKAEGV
jgi:hypothetical protein